MPISHCWHCRTVAHTTCQLHLRSTLPISFMSMQLMQRSTQNRGSTARSLVIQDWFFYSTDSFCQDPETIHHFFYVTLHPIMVNLLSSPLFVCKFELKPPHSLVPVPTLYMPLISAKAAPIIFHHPIGVLRIILYPLTGTGLFSLSHLPQFPFFF